MSHIDTSPAALKALADEALCNTAFVPKSLLLAIAAEKEAQASQEPVGEWVDYDDGFGPRLRWLQGYVVTVGDKLYLAPQHHKDQHLNMVAPADSEKQAFIESEDKRNREKMKRDSGQQTAPVDLPLPEPLAQEWDYDHSGEGRNFLTGDFTADQMHQYAEAYAKAAVADVYEQCVRIIEGYQVPAGNSAAGEMAAEWTMDALREVRETIRAAQKGTT